MWPPPGSDVGRERPEPLGHAAKTHADRAGCLNHLALRMRGDGAFATGLLSSRDLERHAGGLHRRSGL